MRIVVQLAIVFAAVCLAQSAAAQCDYPAPECQPNGASEGVEKPDGWTIRLPFENGETVRVTSGYGPDAGSSLHCRSSDTVCANDWFALDLVLQDHANNGFGQPVVATADGVVLDAAAGSEGWAGYGNRVYLEHDGPDGNTYVSMYAHMDSITVSNGDTVQKGDQVGTLGDTCFLDGCNLGAHLHFSIHRNSSFGGSGSGGSYAGRAVIPEPIDGYTDITQGDILTAGNGPDDPDPDPQEPYCDVVIGSEEIVLEEDGPCGEVVGEPADAAIGSGGHSYTATLENPSPDYGTGVIWHFVFDSAGSYDVRVNVPQVENAARETTYKLQFAGGESTKLNIDQAAVSGEVRLGRFDFDATSDQWLRLGDNYDDAGNQGQTFVMDSVRFIPAELCECEEEGASEFEQCDVAGDRSRMCDGCFYGEWSDCPPVDIANNSPGNNQTNGGDDSDSGGTTGEEKPNVVKGEGGCGCGAVDASAGLVPLLLLIGFFGRRRLRSTR